MMFKDMFNVEWYVIVQILPFRSILKTLHYVSRIEIFIRKYGVLMQKLGQLIFKSFSEDYIFTCKIVWIKARFYLFIVLQL